MIVKNESLIFDIKKYSINDGPGIRVTLFFKGCGLHCDWCHNPESQSRHKEKMYNAQKCIGCFTCIEACPNDALSADAKAGIVTDTDRCAVCGICAEVCPANAVEISGKNYNVAELMQIIRRERLTMDTSDGGVTFSGGDPMQHPDILLEWMIANGFPVRDVNLALYD